VVFSGYSQNLVPNHSFENFTGSCAFTAGSASQCNSWSNVNASPDYFHTAFCGTGLNFDTPSNYAGTQSPADGVGYIALVAWHSSAYNEVLGAPLTSALTPGAWYDVSMKVSLTDISTMGSDNLGVLFGTSPTTPIGINFAHVSSNTVITDFQNWTVISGSFQASAAYTYIFIGNFFDNANTNTLAVASGGWYGGAYYYIDDVQVTAVNQPPSLTLTGDTVICLGDTAFILATDDISFAWATQSNPTLIFSTDSFITVSPAATETYICYGSVDTAYHTVTVYLPPVVNLLPDSLLCPNDTAILDAENPGSQYLWNDGSINQTLQVTTTGTYSVSVTNIWGCVSVDSATISYWLPSGTLDLGNDTTLCLGEILTLDATTSNAVYLWQDNSTNPSFDVNQQGTYWVEVTVNNCTTIDTITVSYLSFPTLDLGNDTTLCQGEILTLDATTLNAVYLWHDNSTNPSFNVNQQGTYWVEVTVNNCTSIDTIIVSYLLLPTLDLGNDTTLCQGETLTLNATTANATYLWQDNSANPTFNVNQQGTYWVEVTVNNCIKTDTIILSYNPLPILDFGNDTTLCQGETLTLNAITSNATYLWQDNSTNPTFIVNQQGTYFVELTVNNCTTTDTIIASYIPLPTLDLGNDTTLCQGETLTLNATTANATYLWQDNSANPTFHADQQSTYWVEVNNYCGTNTDTLTIEFKDCDCSIYIPNAFTPNNDGINDVFAPKTNCDFNEYWCYRGYRIKVTLPYFVIMLSASN